MAERTFFKVIFSKLLSAGSVVFTNWEWTEAIEEYFLTIYLNTSWLLAFLTQLNPLVGPQMNNALAAHIRRVWSVSERPEGLSEDCKGIEI